MRLTILLILVLSACCQAHNKQVSIPAEVQPYIDSFQADAGSQNVGLKIDDLVVQFDSLDQPDQVVYGRCVYGYNMTPVVKLDKSHWDNGSSTFRETLVYHELGHCLLNRLHINLLWQAPNGARTPFSIMYANSAALDYYQMYRQHYIQELFRRL